MKVLLPGECVPVQSVRGGAEAGGRADPAGSGECGDGRGGTRGAHIPPASVGKREEGVADLG
jgi:hypothetical protein